MKIVLLFTALLALTACAFIDGSSQTNPNETVSAFFTHIQADEFVEAEQLLSTRPPISFNAIAADHEGIFDNLEYKIVSETVNGNRAYLTVNINALDFVQIMEAVISESFFWAFEEISEAELHDIVNQLLIEKMSAEDAPILENEIIIVLELENNQWRIVPDDIFLDGVSGGILSFAEQVAGW